MILLDTALAAGVGTADSVMFPSWLINALWGIAGALSIAIAGMWRYIVTINNRSALLTEKAVEVMTKAISSMDRLTETVALGNDRIEELIKDFRDELRRTA